MTVDGVTRGRESHGDRLAGFPEDLLIASTLAGDGGLPIVVGGLARVLRQAGRQVRIMGPCMGAVGDALRIPGVAVSKLPAGNGLFSTTRAVIECCRAVRRVGRGCGTTITPIIHIHGVWTPPVLAAAREAISLGVPFILSPHGMLMEAALHRSSVRKRLALVIVVRRILERARIVHCSSDAEAAAVRRVASRSKTLTIPFGVDFPAAHVAEFDPRPRVAGYLGRLVEVKNLATLIRAWSAVRPAGWRLRIAGPDGDGTRARLESLLRRLHVEDTVTLDGPVPPADVPAFLSSLAVYIQPSRSENFGLAIAEALASGTPVITTTGTPWQDIPSHRCGWYVPPTEDGLTEAIRQAVVTPFDALADMGRRGAEWIAAEYSWDGVAPRYLHDLYELPADVRSA
ncbi:MAG: glycosyltransferase [Planctomycetaceae bacterium]|nr:glycosyltransferase [Planctomycetaceae bacterium]